MDVLALKDGGTRSQKCSSCDENNTASSYCFEDKTIKDKTITVLSHDGKNLLQSFSAPGCDAEPRCVVYQQDKFFVSYPDANRVMVFNNAGEYLYDIGSKESGDGQFSCPTGLAIDKFDRLIVCNADNDRLQLFTLDGKYVAI